MHKHKQLLSETSWRPFPSQILTLKTVEQLWVADMFICAMTEALVVSLPPGVHLAIFS